MEKSKSSLFLRMLLVGGILSSFSIPLFAEDKSSTEEAPETILVKWRGLELTRQDFNTFMDITVPPMDQGAFRGNMKRITNVLENLQVQRTLASEAVRDGLDKDEKIARELAYEREKFLAKKRLEAWEKALVLPDFTMAAEEYYALHSKEFTRPEMVRVQHVLISTEKHGEGEAQKIAETVREKALAGEDFAKLADEFSEDPTVSKNHGDLGFFARGRMVGPFEDVAFSMKKTGEISELVKTNYGIHILRFGERKAEERAPFEEVKEKIIGNLKVQYISEQRGLYLNAIKADESTILNTKAIDALYIDTDGYIRDAMEKMRKEKEASSAVNKQK